jgi:hypothetical protein
MHHEPGNHGAINATPLAGIAAKHQMSKSESNRFSLFDIAFSKALFAPLFLPFQPLPV